MEQKIHIALTFDDGFWAPAYATMRSVCLLTKRRKDLVFHLCHIGLSPAHRADLDKIRTEFGATLIDYDLGQTDVLAQRIGDLPNPGGRLNPIVYARLFLFDIVPREVGRLIFLDCDLFVRVAIEQLYEMDLGDKLVAAALCPYRTGFQTRRDLEPKPFFDTAEPYFNAGVVLFDAACATVDVVAELRKVVAQDDLKTLFFDQDILNVVYAGRFLPLDARWNLQEPKPCHEPLDPFIVHYTGTNKPWNIFGRTAYKRIYRHMMTNALYYQYWRFRWKRRIAGWLGRAGR